MKLTRAVVTAWVFLSAGRADAQVLRFVLDPPANAAGWNNTAVTATPLCIAGFRCPDDTIRFDQEGRQEATRSASDQSGRVVTATTAVNIDRVAPVVELVSPGHSADWATGVVTARVYDERSGVAIVRCNGSPAPFGAGVVTCVVGLHDGINDVAITAVDRAGNVASLVTRVHRPAQNPDVEIVPSFSLLSAGESHVLQFVDNAGDPIEGANWRSANPDVAAVDPQGEMLLARAPGTAVITATREGRTARMDVEVIAAGQTPPAGAVTWRMKQRPGTVDVTAIRTINRDQLIFISADVRAQYLVAQGVLNESFLWHEYPATAASERYAKWMGDNSGAGLLWMQGRSSSAIVRVGVPEDEPLWRYESESPADGAWAMNPEGTLFLVERPLTGYAQVTAIDSHTGTVRFRVPVPHASELPPNAGRLIITDADEAVLPFVRTEDPSGAKRAVHVQLLRIDNDGMTNVTPVGDYIEDAATVIEPVSVYPYGFDDKHLVFLKIRYRDGRVSNRIVRLSGNDRSTYSLPTIGEYVLGEDGAYTNDGQTLVAFDPVTGRVRWTRSAPPAMTFALVYATARGGVILDMLGAKPARYHVDTDGTINLIAPLDSPSVPIR